MSPNARPFAKYFDHTALAPETGPIEIRKLCAEAHEYGFAAVCVNPIWVPLAKRMLVDSPVKVASVCGFPLGANRTDIKTQEAVKAVLDGAAEIDLVANIGWLVSDGFLQAGSEIDAVRRELPDEVILKVIIECNKLTANQQREAARAVADNGAHFVKTGTGFFGAVRVDQIMDIRDAIGDTAQIKAAGGIRALAQCRELIDAGSDRLGCSKTVAIMREALESGLDPSL